MAFTGRCIITPLTGKVPSTQTNFPVLIYATHNDLKLIANGGKVTQKEEIRCFSDLALTSAVDFQRWYYDGTAGTFIAFAKIPSVAVGTPYCLGFGDPSLTSDVSTSSVWSTTFDRGVWPVSKDGSTIDVNDHSPNGRNGSNTGVTAAAGRIVGSGDFERSNNDYVSVADHASLDMGTGNFTIAGWVKRKSTGIFGGIASKLDGADARGWTLAFNSDNTISFLTVNNPLSRVATSGNTFSSTATWYFVVGTRENGANQLLYVNAASEGSDSGTALDIDNSEDLAFGPYRSGAIGTHMNDAYMSDLRLGAFIASPNFITTMFNAENDPASFASYVFDSGGSEGGPIVGGGNLLKSALLSGGRLVAA